MNGETIKTPTQQTVDGTFYHYIFESPQFRNGEITVAKGSTFEFDIELVIAIPYDLHSDHRLANLRLYIQFTNNKGINLVETFSAGDVYTYERINVHAPRFNGSLEIDNRFPNEFEVSIGAKFLEGVASDEELQLNNDQWLFIANASIDSSNNYDFVIVIVLIVGLLGTAGFIIGKQIQKVKSLRNRNRDDKPIPKDQSITKDHRKLI
ncbi:MAG: hypothetical protein GPJ54_20400 [Candidatus Heimdallarchaeota archaeon]|nr:hypothetical protein [Candidatus Heimdallarchaeota archaeon]